MGAAWGSMGSSVHVSVWGYLSYIVNHPPAAQSTTRYLPIEEEGSVKEPPLTPDEEAARPPSLWLINFNTFAMNVEYSCLMPTVHKYTESLGGDAMFFGLLLSTFSIVRMIV